MLFSIGCAILIPVSERKTVMKIRLEDSWKDYFNEVAAACNYWELGFGDIDAEMESEVVRWAFANKLDTDAACDAWREAINEHMYERVL